MKYRLQITTEFKKDLKRCKKRGQSLAELWTIVGRLLNGEQLEERYRPHKLHGDRRGQWECHIQPDWLLIWEQNDQELILLMLNTGSHADLFSRKHRK